MAVLATVLAVAGVLPAPSLGAERADPAQTQEQIDQVRSQLEFVDGAVEQALAELDDALERFSATTERLVAAQERLADAEKHARTTAASAAEARSEAQRLTGRLEDRHAQLEADRQRLRAVARTTYKYGVAATDPNLAMLELLGDADTAGDVAHSYYQLSTAMDDRAEITARATKQVRAVAGLRASADAADEQQREQHRAALAARDEAGRLHAEVQRLTEDALDEEERRQALLGALQGDRDQLEQRLAELERVRDEALAARAAEKRQRAAAAAARRASSSTGAPRSGPPSPVTSRGDGLATVEGITVAASLAPRLAALLADARADGIELSGWGWRSTERQKALRRINGCPDIHTSPASSCRVPTARPGQSQHETGLAVDFTYKGQTLCFPSGPAGCRGTNAGFDWLDANAHRYGLKVLSSEAWHWSTTGR